MANVNISFDLPDELVVKDFILIGKVYDVDGFYDIFTLDGVLGSDGVINDIDPVNKAGLKNILLNN